MNLNKLLVDNIYKHRKCLFIVAFSFVSFFIIHFRLFIDRIHVADMFRFRLDSGPFNSQGRVLRGVLNYILTKLQYNYIVYYLYFLISIFFLSLGIYFLIRYLELLNDIFYSIVIILLFSTFYSFQQTFIFVYDIPFYTFAFTLSNLSLLCLKYNKKLLYIILSLISLSIYQAYFIYTITMIIVFLIKEALLDEKNMNDICIELVKSIVYSLVSIVLYYFILKFYRFLFTNINFEYGSDIKFEYISLYKFLSMYVKFFLLFIFNYRDINFSVLSKALYFIFTSSIIVFYIRKLCLIYKYSKTQKLSRIIFCIFCFMMLPLIVSILSLFIYIKPVMMMPNFSFFVLLILLFKNFVENFNVNRNFNLIKFIIALETVSLFLLFLHNAYLTIGGYEYNLECEKKNINLLNQIYNQILSIDNFNDDMKVYINVDMQNNENRIISNYDSYPNYWYFNLGYGGPYPNCLFDLNNLDLLCQSMEYYLCANVKPASINQIQLIKNSDEFKNMTVWPNSGSVKCIYDVAVVKICN